METAQRRFGNESFKIIVPNSRTKIVCSYDYQGKFSIDYSGNRYKILKTIIKKIDKEICSIEKTIETDKKSNILLDNFILTLNYSGLDKKYTRANFFRPSLTNIYAVVKYKGTSISVKLNKDLNPSFSLSTMNADDAINAAEYINIFKEKWLLTQL